ncbi:hypothetical protein L1987_23240 [Smallanthus sonchifolius]|uniref:Uncharacterized protein n=1 Tax=Smallanthus sonchifolius TaxID=185202 RepID=A0ACB9IH37_9ASTR|nr:hypothetical protein L1987_23240 [Smallanthus sonchifolius]
MAGQLTSADVNPNNGPAVGVHINQRRRLPDFLQTINLKHVKLGYHYLISHVLTLCLIPIIIVILIEASQTNPNDLRQLWIHLQYNLVSAITCSAVLVFGSTVYIMTRPKPVYLVDYACYRPPDHLKAPYEKFMKHSRLTGDFNESALDFQRKILERSGLGEETYVPEAMHSIPRGRPWRPRSAGVIAVDLAKDMLQVFRNTYAIVVSTENITQNWYFGNKKSMLIPNCLFRVGGSAVLLSNKLAEKKRAKYKLIHVVRTHCGSDDKAFRCVYQEQDESGKTGVSLSKDLMAIAGGDFFAKLVSLRTSGKLAGGALKTNITTLGPLVLPISEQILFFCTLIVKKLFKSDIKPYIPDFKLAFDHFCIHAGGRAVIDELEKNLQLLPTHVEASRMTLHRFGNTSSSSI